MNTVEESVKIIMGELRAARAHYRLMLAEMDRLEQAGMYPAIPSENWQTRNGSGQYLYMVFQRDRKTGQYQGPNGSRKVYVGKDPAKIEQARQMARNRQEWERLEQDARRLRLWVNEFVADMSYRANKAENYPRVVAILGQPGAAGQPPAGPNEPEPLEMLPMP